MIPRQTVKTRIGKIMDNTALDIAVKADGGKTVGERVVEKLKGKTVVVPESVKIADMSAVGKDGPVEQVTIEVKFK